MGIRHDELSEASSAPRLLTSAPWIVVILGVGLLTALLIFVLLSLRTPEPQAVPAPAPPIYLPTMAAGSTASAPPTGTRPVDPTGSPSPSLSVSPSATVSSAQPSGSPTAVPRSGTVTARYQVTRSERDFFEARLTVTNGSAGSRDWRVELLFTGNVKSIQASSSSGVSVSNQGSGVFVLRGTSPLGSGGTATVQMRFGRTGTGDQPGQCTVNGAACAIG